MNESTSPWIKLAALAIVGGVAKSLFGTPYQTNTVTHITDAAKDMVETVKGA